MTIKMFPKAVLFSLLSLVLIVSATGLECMIYVSSSDGINNTSCWTGGYQIPCATLDLALQGTLTVQDKCSSGTVINLSPGNYTLDTTTLLEQQLLRNNVSIIGMRNGSRYEEVNITCLHVSSSSYHWLGYIVFQCVSLYNCNNVPVSCTQPSFDLTTHNPISQEVCPVCSNLTLSVKFINLHLIQCYEYDYDYYHHYECNNLQFTVSIIDNCKNATYHWYSELHVCATQSGCSYVTLQSNCDNAYYLHYELDDFSPSNINPFEVSLYIQTIGLVNINVTVNVTKPQCKTCDKAKGRYVLPIIDQYGEDNIDCLIGYNYGDDYDCCYDECKGQYYKNCTSDTGVPINYLTCVKCKDYPLGILVFILIEILPITLMVILIIILNIQLTNGSINGVIFYSQIIAIIHSLDNLNQNYFISTFQYSSIIPCSIFNVDFTPLLYNYPLCIAPHMSPLEAISFWYVIGFYPLLLLLLIYVWIILYDKGFKCVVFITRPFHRCMARFWSMTGIEPSLTNSIASIYILSFTQLTATSFKILSFNNTTMGYKFYYDAKQNYFYDTAHGFAGSFAILVLLIVILLPTLYIQFYPFKWFHKLLDCLHLRKQLLISLGDIFTGPYKNGSENTFDYRFMAGLYLLAKIIILFSFCFQQYQTPVVSITQVCCSFLLAVTIFIFRAFQQNIHNYCELLMISITAGIGCTSIISLINDDVPFYFWLIVMPIINGLVFGIIIPGYIIYKTIKTCRYYHKKYNAVIIRVQEDTEPLVDNDDDWVADRMENPQEYNEQHVAVRLFEVSEEYHQPIVTTTAATYGSINETNT